MSVINGQIRAKLAPGWVEGTGKGACPEGRTRATQSTGTASCGTPPRWDSRACFCVYCGFVGTWFALIFWGVLTGADWTKRIHQITSAWYGRVIRNTVSVRRKWEPLCCFPTCATKCYQWEENKCNDLPSRSGFSILSIAFNGMQTTLISSTLPAWPSVKSNPGGKTLKSS